MAKRVKIRVRVDADLVLEAREILGARNTSETVELALTIALAMREPQSEYAAKYLKILASGRYAP
jgi:Arc/MetJ family transcription regulator